MEPSTGLGRVLVHRLSRSCTRGLPRRPIGRASLNPDTPARARMPCPCRLAATRQDRRRAAVDSVQDS